MMTYHKLLQEGKQRLEDAGYTEQTAQLLMAELCGQMDINLYMEMDNEINLDLQTAYLEAVHRMELNEPMAYVLGYEWFYGYKFKVDADVLIPRPETEELVALVLSKFDERYPERDKVQVFDVATGSGAIGIALALEEPRMQVMASDLSQKALEVAGANNDALQAGVEFIQGSMLDPFIEKGLHCDILVSNPPYIPNAEEMEASVVDFEPHMALFGGSDGLDFYRDIFSKASQVVRPDGCMAFEMGWDQGQRLMELARAHFKHARIEIHQDINGKDRMLWVEFPAEKEMEEHETV